MVESEEWNGMCWAVVGNLCGLLVVVLVNEMNMCDGISNMGTKNKLHLEMRGALSLSL